jgi:flagellar hook-associated protein 2
MGSVSSPLSSTSSSPITFNGSSTYASDFQTVLNTTVQRASQPLDAMQTQVTTLTGQETAIAQLQTTFGALQTALQNIGTASVGSPSAQSSDSSAVSATASAGALNGTYTIQVDNPGSSTTTLSDAGSTVTDPTTQNISSVASFTLTVNGSNYTINPSGSSLDDLANAINAASDGVSATIVNVGSNTSPDYRLSVTSNHLNDDTIQLSDGTQPLLKTLSTGTEAEYQVNPAGSGPPQDIASTSSQVILSPGLTVNLVQQTSSPVTITVATDYSGLQSALSNFATAYNNALSAVNQQVGQNGGALSGQSIVYSLQNLLNSLTTYTGGSGSIQSLASLGLTLDPSGSGQLDFNASTFSAADPATVQQFLGSVSSSGFLYTANNAVDALADPTNGILQADGTAIQTQITNVNSQIAQQQTIVNEVETNLQAQLSQADAAIATLQAQTSYYTELLNTEYSNGGTLG